VVVDDAVAALGDPVCNGTSSMADLGWLLLVGVVSTGVVELAVIGVAILGDGGENRVFPRWGSALNFLTALAFVGGALSIFFTTGPFAWNGVVGYWIPVFAFAFWILGMTFLLLRAVNRQELNEAAARADDDFRRDPSSHVARLSSELKALRKEVALLSDSARRRQA
jgi:hypothetical protein